MKIMGNNFENKLFQPIHTLFTHSLPKSYNLYKVEDTMRWTKTLLAHPQAGIYVHSTVQQTVVA
jgi:hypothetical protein